jgi:phosphate/sulfate permease
MENQQKEIEMTQEQVLAEIYLNTKATKRYMQWQFYITIALVVLPILGLVVAIPMIMRSFGSMYGGLLQ